MGDAVGNVAFWERRHADALLEWSDAHRVANLHVDDRDPRRRQLAQARLTAANARCEICRLELALAKGREKKAPNTKVVG
jgi:hypothetical protein